MNIKYQTKKRGTWLQSNKPKNPERTILESYDPSNLTAHAYNIMPSCERNKFLNNENEPKCDHAA